MTPPEKAIMSVEAEATTTDAVGQAGAEQIYQEFFDHARLKLKRFEPPNAKITALLKKESPGEADAAPTASGTAHLLSFFGCGDVADVDDERDDSPNGTIELQLVDDDKDERDDGTAKETREPVDESTEDGADEVLAIVEESDDPGEYTLKVKRETRHAPSERGRLMSRSRIGAKRGRSRGRSRSKARDDEQRSSRRIGSRSRSRRPIKLRQKKTSNSTDTGTVSSSKTSWANSGSVGQKEADDTNTVGPTKEADEVEAETDDSTLLSSNEYPKRKRGKPDRAGKLFPFKVSGKNAQLASENERLRMELAHLSLASENQQLRAEVARLKAQENENLIGEVARLKAQQTIWFS
ncbi:hypothetical protein THAOC_16698 [Thalassiosira oceanica]|uniref:Uncharacterized protein n=1 Tax=Thalassiosira oceanica TaxID=159749 RepID=K0SCQ3_THAOC|nr:hypothetical protein THAOC_16698 [Thalassiosira oceanica]|eukprot:EJK62679.1 hypothetical protein THAOC_16698 [Thalassiosira oceanica]